MATATAAPADVPNFKIVSRLDGVPAIHDSVAYAQTLINSTQITGSLYQTALGLASKSYEIATPILTRTKPLLESADGLAVAAFDRAEATFPYPFKTPTEELVVIKQAKGVYDARVAPVIADVVSRTTEINHALGARVQTTIQTSQDYSHVLLEHLRVLTAHGKELPHQLSEVLIKTTGEVKEIVFAKEVTIQEKSNKLGAYVIDHVKPVVDQVYEYVLGAKNKVQAEASTVAAQVESYVEKAAPASK